MSVAGVRFSSVRTRLYVVGGAFVLAVALVAGAAWWFGVRHVDGPLEGASVPAGPVCMSAQGSSEFSYNLVSLRNEAGKDLRITDVALVGDDGFVLTEAVVTSGEQPIATATREWPPPDSQLVWSNRSEAVGTRLPPARSADRSWQLVLRLKLADDRAIAKMSGVRVDYTVGTRRYRAESGRAFSVVRNGPCTEGDMATPSPS